MLEPWRVGAMDSEVQQKVPERPAGIQQAPCSPGWLRLTIHSNRLLLYLVLACSWVCRYAYVLHTYTHICTRDISVDSIDSFLIFAYFYSIHFRSLTCQPGTNGKSQAQRNRLSQRASPRTTSMPWCRKSFEELSSAEGRSEIRIPRVFCGGSPIEGIFERSDRNKMEIVAHVNELVEKAMERERERENT